MKHNETLDGLTDYIGVFPKLILDQFWVSFAVHVIETRGNIATGKELRPASFLAMINDSVQTFEIEQLPMNPQVI